VLGIIQIYDKLVELIHMGHLNIQLKGMGRNLLEVEKEIIEIFTIKM